MARGQQGAEADKGEEEREEEREEDELAAHTEAAEDQFEAAMGIRTVDTWSTGGVKKDIVVRVLVQCFASMVESIPKEDAVPDFKGRFKTEDMEYHKLLDASRQVVKAKKSLLKNENFETRDFTIFIANKQWVANILRPLLELSGEDDSNLAINCAGLALVLVRRIADKALLLLNETKKRKAKPQTSKLIQSVSASTEKNKSIALSDSDVDEVESSLSTSLQNAIDQMKALLSFKTALCSEKANLAITNAFRDFWMKEQVESTPDTKLGVAICLSYFRRILAIGPHPVWCSAGDLVLHADTHHQYIVQLRALLSVIPAICSDLRRAYHDDWLVDVIHIIYYVLHVYDAKDMFVVHKSGGVIREFHTLLEDGPEEQGEEPTTLAATLAAVPSAAPTHRTASAVHVPDKLKALYSHQAQTKGLLSDKLRSERTVRTQIASNQQRFGRFASTYRQSVPNATGSHAHNDGASVDDREDPIASLLGDTPGGPGDAGATPGAPVGPPSTSTISNDCVYLRDVFAHRADSIPQAKVKRNKRHLAFVRSNPYLSSSHAQGQSALRQQATVIATSFLEVFSQEACFKTFVRRVNEDLRRDERRITQEVEVEYLAIVCKVMQYNRFKLQQDFEGHVQAAATTAAAAAAADPQSDPAAAQGVSWQPSFKNIIDALDKMSFTRVVTMVEKLFIAPNSQRAAMPLHRLANVGGGGAAPQLVCIQLYTEMVAYLRMMLYSDNLTFHEIALGALNRLFYAAQGTKLDVLPRLWATYKPHVYSKDHLHALILCTHETLKAMDTAHSLFVLSTSPSAAAATELQRMYMGFVDSLHGSSQKKRLTKREMDMEMYVYACYKFSPAEYLRKLASVDTSLLYMKALQDLEQNPMVINYCIFKYVERLREYKIDRNDGGSGQGAVDLSFTLFSLQVLCILSGLLNNIAVCTNPKFAGMVALLRQLVRDFAKCARRNHALYVEALLNTITGADQCMDVYTVYSAHEGLTRGQAIVSSRGTQVVHSDDDADASPFTPQPEAARAANDALGDELDDNNLVAAVVPQPKASKKRADKRKMMAQLSEEEGDGEGRGAAEEHGEAEPKRRRTKWSGPEDDVLRRLFLIYKSARSVYSTIAAHDDLIALGTERSAQQIANRIRALGLTKTGVVADAGVEAGEAEEGDAAEPQKASRSDDEATQRVGGDSEMGQWGAEEEDVFEQRAMRLQQLSRQMRHPVPPRTFGRKPGRSLLQRGAGAAKDSDDEELAMDEGGGAPSASTAYPSALAKMLESDEDD